jgi:hypothetical protein
MKSHITTELEAKLDINMSLVLGARRGNSFVNPASQGHCTGVFIGA